MFEKVYAGCHTMFNAGGMYIPYEYTDFREEVLASKTSAYIGTVLNTSPVYDVEGPDAAKFLTSVCVNDFTRMKEGTIRHAVMCNDKGQILTDGVIAKVGDNHFRTYWMMPVVDYYMSVTDMDVKGTDLRGKEFFIQIAGPKSLEIIENATGESIRDIKFVHHRMSSIAGEPVRILRLGMAGTLGYELHGDMAVLDKVYEILWNEVQKFGGKKLGQVAYCMNHTEAGFPNINTHYPMPWFEHPGIAKHLESHPDEGYFNWNRQLVGSVGDDLEIRFKTPYDCGWGYLVNFDHDFPGKEALAKIAENPPHKLVTLEWNPDDIGAIYTSWFRGRGEEPAEPIEARPTDVYYLNPVGMHFHADKVMCGDQMIGTSSGRLQSVYYRRMISLGYLDTEYAVEGREYILIWGTPGTRQFPVRVKVCKTPYLDFENNKDIDVTKLD